MALFKYVAKSIKIMCLAVTGSLLCSAAAYAACSTPAGIEGDLDYYTPTKQYRYCNDTNWVVMGGAGSIAIDDLSDAATPGLNIFLGHEGGSVGGTDGGNIALGSTALDALANSNAIFNIAIGSGALTNCLSCDYNIAIGYNALRDNDWATNNVAIGSYSIESNLRRQYNTAVGSQAMQYAFDGTTLSEGSNTAIGYSALAGSTTPANNSGIMNTVIGSRSMEDTTSGSNNVAIGYRAGDIITSGSDNIIIGYLANPPSGTTSNYLNLGGALYGDMTTGNLAFGGTAALRLPDGTTAQRPTGAAGMIRYNTSTGSFEGHNGSAWGDIGGGVGAIDDLSDAATDYGVTNSIFLGHAGGSFGANDSNNIGIGYNALDALNNTTGRNNVGVGSNTLTNNTSGESNVALGSHALRDNTTGADNVAIGLYALSYNVGATQNVAIGSRALYYANNTSSATPAKNTAIGYYSLMGSVTPANNTGVQNTAIGAYAMNINESGGYNTAVGVDALRINKVGNYNTAIGMGSLYNTDSNSNTAIGYFALRENVARVGNTAVGAYALHRADSTSTGSTSNNTGIGYLALQGSTTASNNTGINNTALGASAGKDYTSGSGNTSIGVNSLQNITTGNNNISIGYSTGELTTTGSTNILIGYNVEPSAAGASNEINIGGTLYGYTSDDRIGIGALPATGVELDVQGDIEFTGTIADVSDVRLKTDIESLSEGQVEKIASLKPVSFKMKDDPEEKTELGFIAQDVRPLFPELIREDEDGYLSMNYLGLIAPMAAAIKEQQAQMNGILAVLDDIRFTGTLAKVSDGRLKANIQPMETGQLEKIMQLRAVSFVMKGDPDDETELGFIAQEVRPLFPDLIREDKEGYLSMNYIGLLAPMAEAMEEQQAQIQANNARIEELLLEFEELEAQIKALNDRTKAPSDRTDVLEAQ